MVIQCKILNKIVISVLVKKIEQKANFIKLATRKIHIVDTKL